MSEGDRAGFHSNLADPATCGEDLPYNLRRMAELAAIHCRGCADYHIWTAAARMTGRLRSTTADRAGFTALIGRQARERAGSGAIDVVIAGAADTGILASAAHAATIAGQNIIARCRFTVLDLCPTPLLLCKEFARDHGLVVGTETADITESGGSTMADIIVMHGVLRFIARRRHADALRRLAGQLKPGGRIVVSNRIRPVSNTGAHSGADSGEAILRMVADGSIECPEPIERFAARIKRYVANNRIRPENELESAEAARALFERAGLSVLQFDVFTEDTYVPGNAIRSQLRMHAVLEQCREKACPGRDPGWEPVFRPALRQSKRC